MKLNWIYRYEVSKENGKTIIRGNFGASAGRFEIKINADGSNSDRYEVSLFDGQFSYHGDKPKTFTIEGAWEIREVTEMFELLKYLKLWFMNYKIGDVVTVEVTGDYGIDVWAEGKVVMHNGKKMVKVPGFESGIETENQYDYDEQYVPIEDIIE